MSMFMAAESALSAEAKEFITNVVSPILMIILVILSVLLVVCIMRQKSDPDNLGAITGNSETYYGKNKSESKEYMFRKATVWFAVAMAVISIVYFILQIL